MARREPTDIPTLYQLADWGDWYDQNAGPTDGWWLGWCPLHDKRHQTGFKPSAMFNFWNGTMRCLRDPTCHEKRVVSLHNLKVLVAAKSGR
jgi:hypothetical protein